MARGAEWSAQIRLLPFRSRPSAVYRRGIRVDGRRADVGHRRTEMAITTGSGPIYRTPSSHHLATEARYPSHRPCTVIRFSGILDRHELTTRFPQICGSDLRRPATRR